MLTTADGGLEGGSGDGSDSFDDCEERERFELEGDGTREGLKEEEALRRGGIPGSPDEPADERTGLWGVTVSMKERSRRGPCSGERSREGRMYGFRAVGSEREPTGERSLLPRFDDAKDKVDSSRGSGWGSLDVLREFLPLTFGCRGVDASLPLPLSIGLCSEWSAKSPLPSPR